MDRRNLTGPYPNSSVLPAWNGVGSIERSFSIDSGALAVLCGYIV